MKYVNYRGTIGFDTLPFVECQCQLKIKMVHETSWNSLGGWESGVDIHTQDSSDLSKHGSRLGTQGTQSMGCATEMMFPKIWMFFLA